MGLLCTKIVNARARYLNVAVKFIFLELSNIKEEFYANRYRCFWSTFHYNTV